MEDFFAVILILVLVFAMAFVGYGVGQENPNDYSKFRVVCEYKGGKAQGNVCILNDRVIDTYGN